MSKEITQAEYESTLSTPITITPQQVADRLHNEIYKNGEPHKSLHSCPCYNLALFYLGVTDSHGLYWPDGDGGNEWDKPASAGRGDSEESPIAP